LNDLGRQLSVVNKEIAGNSNKSAIFPLDWLRQFDRGWLTNLRGKSREDFSFVFSTISSFLIIQTSRKLFRK
jgi:hypothetical protein